MCEIELQIIRTTGLTTIVVPPALKGATRIAQRPDIILSDGRWQYVLDEEVLRCAQGDRGEAQDDKWGPIRGIIASVRLSPTARVLFSLYIPSMIMSFGQGMVVPTIPVLAKAFDVSVGLAAQAVTAQLVARVLALVPAGMLVDRAGRRPLLIAGPVIMAAGAAMTALAPAFWVLLAGQFLTGAGSTLWQTAREIAAVDVVRPEQRGRMMSGFMGMHSVGVAAGPVLGGIITDTLNFRAVFWVYTVMALITLAISARIRETAQPRRGERAPLFNFGRLSEVEPYFRVTYVVIVINTFVAMMRSSLINSMLPLYVGVQLGYSSTQVGTLFGLYGLVNILMIAPTGVLMDSLGRKAVVVPSTYLAALVFFAFPLAAEVLQLSVLVALTGVATGLALGTMATYTYDVIPEHARGRLQATRRTIAEAGALLGPMAAGIIADARDPGAAFWFFVPIQFISGLLITFLAKESLHHVRERSP